MEGFTSSEAIEYLIHAPRFRFIVSLVWFSLFVFLSVICEWWWLWFGLMIDGGWRRFDLIGCHHPKIGLSLFLWHVEGMTSSQHHSAFRFHLKLTSILSSLPTAGPINWESKAPILSAQTCQSNETRIMTTSKSSICPLQTVAVILVAVMLLPSTESFIPKASRASSSPTSTSGTPPKHLRSLFDDDKEEVGSVDLQSFNPLNYQAGNVKNPVFNQISLRKIRMQEMTGELLNAGGDEAMTNEILNRFKDFLLEPLDDPNAVLVSETAVVEWQSFWTSAWFWLECLLLQESDSIYTPQMSRKERYEAYRTSMDQRIQSSKNGSVRSVLQSMRDFVLSFEDE